MEINKCLFFWFHFEHRNHCRAHNKTWFLAYAPQSTANQQLKVWCKVLCLTFCLLSPSPFCVLWFQLSCDWIYHLWVLSFLKLNSTFPRDLNQKLLEGESLLLQLGTKSCPPQCLWAVFVVDHRKRNGAATHRQSDQTLLITQVLMPKITTCSREGW